MFRDRGVARVWQPQLTQAGAALGRGKVFGRARGQEAFGQHALDLRARELRAERAAHDRAPAAEHSDGRALDRIIAE